MADRDVHLSASIYNLRQQLSPYNVKEPQSLCLYNFSDEDDQKRKVGLALESEKQFQGVHLRYGLPGP